MDAIAECTCDECHEERLTLARLWLNARHDLAEARRRIARMERDRHRKPSRPRNRPPQVGIAPGTRPA